jgi:type I restriction enzyme S subunit
MNYGAKIAPWPEVTLGNLLARIEAGQNFKCEGRPPNEGEIGIVKVSAVTWGEYDEEESKTVTNNARVDAKLFVTTSLRVVVASFVIEGARRSVKRLEPPRGSFLLGSA